MFPTQSVVSAGESPGVLARLAAGRILAAMTFETLRRLSRARSAPAPDDTAQGV